MGKRLGALLLALLFAAGMAPAAYAAGTSGYRDYARYDRYDEADYWDDSYFFRGDRYWNARDYWVNDFFYRDNYYWGPDFIRDLSKRGNALYFTSPNVDRDGAVIRGEALRQIGYAAQRSADDYAVLRVINGEMMTSSAMQGLGAEARGNGGKTALVCAYTMLPGQRTHQTRLYFEPEQFAASGRDVRLGVYSDNEWIYETKQEYLDEFANYVELIRFAQRDEFPAPVQAYALIDLSKLNKDHLRFYSVNRDTGSVTEIGEPNYSFAENGKLTFHTKLAGDILISDRALEKKVKSNGWISDERIQAETPQALADAAAAAAQKAADLAAQADAAAQAAAGSAASQQAMQDAAQAAADAAQAAADAAQAAADAAAQAGALNP